MTATHDAGELAVLRQGDTPGHADAPLLQLTWTDPLTPATGYLVVHSLIQGLTTGGTRMRPGCTQTEIADLARGMADKTAAFAIPVGGAKGGIDFDPKRPEATGVLERYFAAMRPWLDDHWVTAEDLGLPQQRIDAALARLGLGQSCHAAIARAADPERTLRRVRAGLNAPVPGGCLLGDVIGGFGVAQAALAVTTARGLSAGDTTVAIQGVGTMGGSTARYLHDAGMRITALADAAGTLYNPRGLDVERLLASRDAFAEIDRNGLDDTVHQLPRESVLAVNADILVPAAISYAIDETNVTQLNPRVVIEAANCATTARAESALADADVPVIPDFVANGGAAAWTWWLLFGQVGASAADSFPRLRTEMRDKVTLLLDAWDNAGIRPRETATRLAARNRSATGGEQHRSRAMS